MTVSSSSGRESVPSRAQVVLVAVVFASIWAVGLALPLGWQGPNPPTQLEEVAFVVFSVMLTGFAAIAWHMVRLAPPDDAIRTMGWILAVGGIVGAVGNFGEDSFRLDGFENIYGIGLLGVMIGVVGMPLVLAVRRHGSLAALSVLTLVALISSFGHGPPVMPVVWFGFAAWVALRGVPRTAIGSATSAARAG